MSTKTIPINLVDITRHNVGQLKLLNKSVLPVKYSDKFYEDTVSNWPRENPWCRLAYHNEYLVAAINARIETFDPEDKLKRVSLLTPSDPLVGQKQRKKQLVSAQGKPLRYRLHITTLSVLEVYRGAQIGTTLLKDIIATAEAKAADIDEIIVYVHTENAKAIEFYKKFGFAEIGTIEGYYKDDVVSPPNAVVMTRSTAKAVAAEEKPE